MHHLARALDRRQIYGPQEARRRLGSAQEMAPLVGDRLGPVCRSGLARIRQGELCAPNDFLELHEPLALLGGEGVRLRGAAATFHDRNIALGFFGCERNKFVENVLGALGPGEKAVKSGVQLLCVAAFQAFCVVALRRDVALRDKLVGLSRIHGP